MPLVAMGSAEIHDVCGQDAALVQGSGQQDPVGAGSTCRVQVGGVAYAPCKEQAGTGLDLGDEVPQQRQIRSLAVTDAVQLHQDHIARIPRRSGGDTARVAHPAAVEIDRQQAARVGYRNGVLPALRANHGAISRLREGGVDRCRRMETAIYPELQGREAGADLVNQGGIDATSLYRVEVGKVENGEAVVRRQAFNQWQHCALAAKRAVDRPIVPALAPTGENGTTLQKIDDGD